MKRKSGAFCKAESCSADVEGITAKEPQKTYKTGATVFFYYYEIERDHFSGILFHLK